jgi:hypothetical protein
VIVIHALLGLAIIALAVGSIVWLRRIEREIRGDDDG